MPFKFVLEPGRLCMINYGPLAGQMVTIVDILDKNRVVIEGPTPEGGFMKRQAWSTKQLHLTPLVSTYENGQGEQTKLYRGAKQTKLLKALNSSNTMAKWHASPHAKRLARKEVRQGLNDFERFVASTGKELQKREVARHNKFVAKGFVTGKNSTSFLKLFPKAMRRKIMAATTKFAMRKSPRKAKLVKLAMAKIAKNKISNKKRHDREKKAKAKKTPALAAASMDAAMLALPWNDDYIEQCSPGVLALAFFVLTFLIMKQFRRFHRKLQDPLVHV